MARNFTTARNVSLSLRKLRLSLSKTYPFFFAINYLLTPRLGSITTLPELVFEI